MPSLKGLRTLSRIFSTVDLNHCIIIVIRVFVANLPLSFIPIKINHLFIEAFLSLVWKFRQGHALKPSALALMRDRLVLMPSALTLMRDRLVLRQSALTLKRDCLVLRQSALTLKRDCLVLKPSALALMRDCLVLRPSALALLRGAFTL